nr:unnamed protein product [Callosobruchus analis]
MAMWSIVTPEDVGVKNSAPSARAKHSATLVGDHVYLLGGRNGNLPMRDFWKYHLVTGKWTQLQPSGDKLPCLQEHTAVVYKDCIYVFGGEVGFSAATETPLWVYDIRGNSWKKKRTKKGVTTPKGRRGHTALVYNGSMLIYGGYQDLKGSCNELWAYHFDTDSWHLLSPSSSTESSSTCPPARHKHSAVLSDGCMWIFGGMTDLQARSDLWRWEVGPGRWRLVKPKTGPGPLHGHAACVLYKSMYVFGGERGGEPCDELWRFSFAFETWERINIVGLKPQPRAESIALTISELHLKSSSAASDHKCTKMRSRVSSADRGNRHSSYLPSNKIAPCETTYMVRESDVDTENQNQDSRTRGFLHEITRLSQNIPVLSSRCSYTVLTACQGDSTESLLRQHASPQEVIDTDAMVATPSRGTMVKSKSAYVIKKKYADASPTRDDTKLPTKKRVEFDSTAVVLPREPISVPNFSLLTLPTPVLTPVEAAKLVYLDSEEENELLGKERTPKKDADEKDKQDDFGSFKPISRGESYSSHIGYADNPLYQQIVTGSMKEKSDENVSSTSDYASLETMNRLSSASSYSVKTNTIYEDGQKNRETSESGPYGFCNPNYMGPVIDKKNAVTILGSQAKTSDDEESLELQNCDGVINRNTSVLYKSTNRSSRPPKSLALDKVETQNRMNIDRLRALSASRVERNVKIASAKDSECNAKDISVYIYIFGGKEQGQVTVFQRPISIWRLKLV